jgi:malate dehydrogenase (oxaloacetate-decarboxylating)
MKINQPTPSPNNDDLALRLHKAYRGKIQTIAKCPLTSQADLAGWYTPGVAAPSLAIHRNPSLL